LKFEKVADFLSLNDDELGRMLPDFLMWVQAAREAEKLGAKVTSFIWIDDSNPMNIQCVRVIDDNGDITSEFVPNAELSRAARRED
jgi:hypothetical protein